MVSMQFLWNLIKSAIVLWKGMTDHSLSAYLDAIQFVYKAVPPDFKSDEELELLGHVLILISGSVKCCDQSTLVLFAETIDWDRLGTRQPLPRDECVPLRSCVIFIEFPMWILVPATLDPTFSSELVNGFEWPSLTSGAMHARYMLVLVLTTCVYKTVFIIKWLPPAVISLTLVPHWPIPNN